MQTRNYKRNTGKSCRKCFDGDGVMKRFFEMKCEACGTVVEKWIRLDEIQETPCPRCGKKQMKRLYSSFTTGASCRTGLRAFRGG